jgi:hypothetical protein
LFKERATDATGTVEEAEVEQREEDEGLEAAPEEEEVAEDEVEAGVLEVSALPEAVVTGLATTVAREATLPASALTSQQGMRDREVAEAGVATGTATTVERLDTWRGTAHRRPPLRCFIEKAFYLWLDGKTNLGKAWA